MIEAVIFLSPPLMMALILVGIHCYLGLHVLSRKIIFSDLSLAQAASFGYILALAMDLEFSSFSFYCVSLGVTFIASGFLTLTHFHKKHISREASIGILYAFFFGLAVVFLDHISHGSEHVKQALMGQLLWVQWKDVLRVFFIYSVVCVFYYLFRKPFMSSSFQSVVVHWKWNFLFYVLFAVVITTSVQSAGVMLVFTFLIVPAFITSFFFQDFYQRLIWGWGIGTVLSVLGICISYIFDLPTGAVLITVLTLTALLTVLGMGIFSRP